MLRTSDGKLVLFELATGKQGEFWPIDAKVLMACGSHGPDAPFGVTAVPPVMPPKHVGVPRTAVVKSVEADVAQPPADTQTGLAPAVDGDAPIEPTPRRGKKKQDAPGQE